MSDFTYGEIIEGGRRCRAGGGGGGRIVTLLGRGGAHFGSATASFGGTTCGAGFGSTTCGAGFSIGLITSPVAIT